MFGGNLDHLGVHPPNRCGHYLDGPDRFTHECNLTGAVAHAFPVPSICFSLCLFAFAPCLIHEIVVDELVEVGRCGLVASSAVGAVGLLMPKPTSIVVEVKAILQSK